MKHAEKHLQEAYEANLAGNGGAAIVMNPNTGEILAMAVAPGYDLNDPHTINDQLLMQQLNEKLNAIPTQTDEADSEKTEKKHKNRGIA